MQRMSHSVALCHGHLTKGGPILARHGVLILDADSSFQELSRHHQQHDGQHQGGLARLKSYLQSIDQ